MNQVLNLRQQLNEQACTDLINTSTTQGGTPASFTIDSLNPCMKKRKLLLDPPEFNGTRRSEFKPWLSQIAAKLSVDLNEESEIV